MSTTTLWTTPGFDDAETPVTIKLHQVNTLVYRSLTVPVWQIDPGQDIDRLMGYHSGPFIRYTDLPGDLAEAFHRWQMCAAIPFSDAAYDYDFEDFMDRSGRGFSGDFSEIVRRYR